MPQWRSVLQYSECRLSAPTIYTLLPELPSNRSLWCNWCLFWCPVATRTPHSLRSVNRSTLKRSWNLRGQGFQRRTGTKNSQPVCNRLDNNKLAFWWEMGGMRISCTPWICGHPPGASNCLHVSECTLITMSFSASSIFVMDHVIMWHCK